MEKPNKYLRSKIYKIELPNGLGTYVGSTCQRLLCQRRGGHMVDSRLPRYSHYPLYAAINALENKWEGIYLTLIEDYPCESIDQLNKQEGEWIRKIGTLNRKIQGRTHLEWRQETKDERVAWTKKYRKDNKVVLAQKKREYDKTRAVCPYCNEERCKRHLKKHIRRVHPEHQSE